MTHARPNLIRPALTRRMRRMRRRATGIAASTLAPIERALVDGILATGNLAAALREINESPKLPNEAAAYRACEAVLTIVRSARVALARRDGGDTPHDYRLDNFYEPMLDTLQQVRGAMAEIDPRVMDGDLPADALVNIARELAHVWPSIPRSKRLDDTIWHYLLKKRN